MKVQNFEDLQIWQHTYSFILFIYKLTSNPDFKRDFGMKDQIQRAAVSIMSNIAEGYERKSNKDFIKFLLYSRGSAGEVRSLLYLAHDLNYITEIEFLKAKEYSINISTQISKFISYLKTHLKKPTIINK